MFEDVDPKVLGAVRALARELRYRAIEPIIGRRIRIESVVTIDATVRAVVPELPPSAKLIGNDEDRSLTLAKYGLLELCYEVDAIAAPPIGFAAMRELGWLEKEPSETAKDLREENLILIDWLEECRAARPLTMLFARGPLPQEIVPRWKERGGWRGRYVEEYLPRELTIIDACESTGSFVWFSKYVYL